MPSFDVVNQIDMQEVDNAVNNVLKEIATRFDFRNIHTEVELNRKEKRINIVSGDEMKLEAIKGMLITHLTRRKVDHRCLEFGEAEPTSKGQVKQEVKLQDGIDKDTAKKIVKMIKDTKLKVQTAIQDEQVRVTGKKIDDLQQVMQMLKSSKLELPLQFVNMKK